MKIQNKIDTYLFYYIDENYKTRSNNYEFKQDDYASANKEALSVSGH